MVIILNYAKWCIKELKIKMCLIQFLILDVVKDFNDYGGMGRREIVWKTKNKTREYVKVMEFDVFFFLFLPLCFPLSFHSL
jgi:hypothetical protein